MEWNRLKRVEVEFDRIRQMGVVEAMGHIPSVAEYIRQLERERSALKQHIHAAHGLIAPLGSQPVPSVMAIREAISILKASL